MPQSPHRASEKRAELLSFRPESREDIFAGPPAHASMGAEPSHDAIITSTLDGIVTGWTIGAEKLYGYTQEEMVGQLGSIVIPMSRKSESERLTSLIRDGHTIPWYETQRVRKDGMVIKVSLTVSPVRNSEGEIVGCCAVTRDIHRTRAILETLRKSEERSLILSRATNDAIWDWDLISDTVWWNDGFRTLFGYDDLVGETSTASWKDRIHPEDCEAVIKSIHDVIDSGEQNWSWEYRFRAADEEYRWVFDRGYVIHDNEAQPVRMIGSMQDITDRVRAEQERDRFFTLSLDMLCSFSQRCEFKRVNPAFTQTLGYGQEQLIGKSITEFAHPDDEPALEALFARAAAGEANLDVEVRIRCSNGEWRWIEWRLANPDQGTIYAVARDTTERKLQEEKLRLANEELENRVKRRTRELERAREVADSANKAKSLFLSQVSHELRTPLNAIIGFTQLLTADKSLPAIRQKQIGHVHTAGEHLLELVNKVLDLTQIEAGYLAIEMEAVCLNEVLREVLEICSVEARERGVLVLDLVGDSPRVAVMADRHRLRQVLLNIITNAIKYNRERGRVTISADDGSAVGYVRLSVGDTGAGLRGEQIEKLFVPFERLEAPRSKVQGTGIGLVLSKGLVEAMKGRLGVDSEPDVGSTFWIELQAAN